MWLLGILLIRLFTLLIPLLFAFLITLCTLLNAAINAQVDHSVLNIT